jgi:hypothetical protein
VAATRSAAATGSTSRNVARKQPERAGTLGKRFEWCVLAEIRDAPASGAQGDAKRDQPEIVLLARSAGKESTRAGAAIPAPREPEEPMIERHYGHACGECIGCERRTPILVLYATGAAAADWRATLRRDIA